MLQTASFPINIRVYRVMSTCPVLRYVAAQAAKWKLVSGVNFQYFKWRRSGEYHSTIHGMGTCPPNTVLLYVFCAADAVLVVESGFDRPI